METGSYLNLCMHLYGLASFLNMAETLKQILTLPDLKSLELFNQTFVLF